MCVYEYIYVCVWGVCVVGCEGLYVCVGCVCVGCEGLYVCVRLYEYRRIGECELVSAYIFISVCEVDITCRSGDM